ncbi:hypothetical protein [Candidatus Nitrosotenuis cloacae]|uniref:hypothetical protein n=1 Tax=Candidatus Nitrosotenuis cloacae TaxID=1603555 RepID=UPI00069B5869|nr:hypothetical protein [Candidatus Nitrosotenuis cloacae]
MKGKIIALAIVCVIIASVIIAITYVGPIDISTPKVEDEFKNWNRSGPFAIDKFEYRVGDSIFITVNGLTPNDIGSAIFVLPNGTTKYISIPFDGSKKEGFNQYFKPAVSKARLICSVDDIVGEWTIIFRETEYSPIKFRMLNETIPEEMGSFQRVC